MKVDLPVFRKTLLAWFKEKKRPLPWRVQPSLYRTVVSEFMLQQTQVDTVLPYFDRWMRAFPDFQSLAEAREEKVLKCWEGLGYYSRARNLHKLARSITAEGIPRSAGAWQLRPGIGPYTAAAIASIAQGLSEPVIDGNVIRVLSRLTDDDTPFRSSTEARKRLLPLARAFIDPDHPGAFNEALMELGATVCRKTRPACLLCPVRTFCRARAAGTQDRLPVMVRRPTSKRDLHRLWLRSGEHLLLLFHAESASRLAGLAELPPLPQPPDTSPLLVRSRGISSERVREHIHALEPDSPGASAVVRLPGIRWVPLAELDSIALSAPHKRWIRELLDISQAD
ncbi:MAG: A/G-specific adenine glycosylase [Oceanipulchritudo sp.]